jgi:hypothetical protein
MGANVLVVEQKKGPHRPQACLACHSSPAPAPVSTKHLDVGGGGGRPQHQGRTMGEVGGSKTSQRQQARSWRRLLLGVHAIDFGCVQTASSSEQCVSMMFYRLRGQTNSTAQ